MNIQLFEAQKMLESFRKGEEKGFSHYMKWLYPSLLYYSFQVIGDKILAEDIVEESFIKIWERRQNFFEAAKIKSWMYATIRNSCFDHWRLQRKEQKLISDVEILIEGDVQKPVDDIMIEAETISAVYRHLHNLPDRCQSVMRLLFIEGKSLMEVALAMKVSINTVKNQRARGLALIRKQVISIHG